MHTQPYMYDAAEEAELLRFTHRSVAECLKNKIMEEELS